MYDTSGGQQYDIGAYGVDAYDAGAYDAGSKGDTGTSYRSSYTSGAAPGKISFTMGDTGYQTDSKIISGEQPYGRAAYGSGAYDAGSYGTGAYGTGSYGTGGHDNKGTNYRAGYASGAAPGKISFVLGGSGYQTGSSAGSGSGYGNMRSSAVSKPYGMYRQKASSIRQSGTQGFAGASAPGRISFTQDFSGVSGQSSGIQRSAGMSGLSATQKTVAPVAVVADEYPSAVAGNVGSSVSSGEYGAGGVSGTDFQEITGIGSLNERADYADGGVKVVSSPVSPAISRPYGMNRQRTSSIRQSGTQGFAGASAPGRISFTQDFSGVSRQSSGIQRSTGISGISATQKTVAPVAVVADEYPRVVAGNFGSSVSSAGYGAGGVSGTDFQEITGIGSLNERGDYADGGVKVVSSPVSPAVPRRPYINRAVHRSGSSQGISSPAVLPQISFTQDFSKVGGLSGVVSSKPQVQSFNRVSSSPGIAPKVSTGRYGQTGIIRSSGILGTTAAQPRISFTQDFSRIGGQSQQFGSKPRVQSFTRQTSPVAAAPVVRPVVQQPSGSRYGSGLRRTSQSASGVGPAKISFIQDFSRVSGQQTSGIKPAISTRNEIPAFPAVLTSPVAPKPIIKPVFKTPKQPVTIVQEPTFTTVYDQSPVQEISGGAVEGHFTADKSSYTSQPVNTGFVREQVVDYKQEITNVGDYGDGKFSEIAYAPRAAAAFYKSPGYSQSGLTSSLGNVVSSYKFTSADRSGDKSNIYVAVPVDATSANSAGMAPAGGYAGEKESYYQITSGNANSGLASLAGQGQVGYSAVTTPFKSYYSSSYPGYSHVSGESPRFDFSQDKSLLYTYSSPYISSPFSYIYTSGKGQTDQVYGKSIA